jgi:hypothetical protein
VRFAWRELLALCAWVGLFIVLLPFGFNHPPIVLVAMGLDGLRLRILTSLVIAFMGSGSVAATLYLVLKA